MRIGVLLGTFLASCVGAALAVAADCPAGCHAPAGGRHPGLEKFKLLAGEWVGKGTFAGTDAGEAHVRYKVTAGGTAVVETEFPDTDHEMVTLIHADGDDLVLTHYCHLGNQPRMKAGKCDGDTVAFRFDGATGLKSDKDAHMHDATYTFVDKDTFKTEWTLYRDGKPAGKAAFEYKRKK